MLKIGQGLCALKYVYVRGVKNAEGFLGHQSLVCWHFTRRLAALRAG